MTRTEWGMQEPKQACTGQAMQVPKQATLAPHLRGAHDTQHAFRAPATQLPDLLHALRPRAALHLQRVIHALLRRLQPCAHRVQRRSCRRLLRAKPGNLYCRHMRTPLI